MKWRIAAAVAALSALGVGAQELRPGQTETFPRAAPPPASGGVVEPGSDRLLKREETLEERRTREGAVFDNQGRIRNQRDQISRQPMVNTDRLRRSQSPDYSVGPGVNIIRR
ncbi:MAG: hypothetical protein WD969_12490 [Paracoccaceae bacterium]